MLDPSGNKTDETQGNSILKVNIISYKGGQPMRDQEPHFIFRFTILCRVIHIGVHIFLFSNVNPMSEKIILIDGEKIVAHDTNIAQS